MSKKNKIHKNLRKFFKNENETELVFNTKIPGDLKRRKRYKKQKENYGFDERETWNLNFTSITWLYSHLERLLKWSSEKIDYYETHHIYTVPVLIKENNIYKYEIIENEKYKEISLLTEDKTLPVGKIIELILEYFSCYIKDDSTMFEETYNLYDKIAQHGIKLYAKIFQSVWW